MHLCNLCILVFIIICERKNTYCFWNSRSFLLGQWVSFSDVSFTPWLWTFQWKKWNKLRNSLIYCTSKWNQITKSKCADALRHPGWSNIFAVWSLLLGLEYNDATEGFFWEHLQNTTWATTHAGTHTHAHTQSCQKMKKQNKKQLKNVSFSDWLTDLKNEWRT